jgi:hypothetical protein
MRKIFTAASAGLLLLTCGASAAEPGCYRWGETGYHWYRFCIGPEFLYPHHHHCQGSGAQRLCWQS